MNNTLTLNQSVVSKYAISLKGKNSLKMFLVLSGLIVTGLLVFYIFQVSAESTERYLIQEYKKKLSVIVRENQGLEMNLVKTNSLDNMIALISELNFEKIDKIHYIRVNGNQIVIK